MFKIQRLIENHLLGSLEAFPVIYIAGPRQSGKTTLTKQIATTEHQATYITFDDLQLRAAAKQDPDALVGRMVLYNLLPFSTREIRNNKQKTFIDDVFSTAWTLST